MKITDERYIGIPWKDGGRNFAGADCVGVTCLFLGEEFGFKATPPASKQRPEDLSKLLADHPFDERKLERGHVVFFARQDGEIRHVAVWLGGGRLLHTFTGSPSRVENGFTLAKRVGMRPVAMVDPAQAELLAVALADGRLGAFLVPIIIAIILAVVASLLMPKPKMNPNSYGKYSFNGLLTQNSPEVPLPDILGAVTVAGNSPYTQLADASLTVSSQAQQAANKIVVLSSAPIWAVDYTDFNILINGVTYTDASLFKSANSTGIYLNPDQTEAACVTGSIGPDTYAPSMTIYDGHHDISVPVDIRAQFDRTFPIYGYSGCCYIVFRLFNSSIFTSFNVNAQVQGRLCRTYDTNGFITVTSTSEAVATGDGVTKRFKLDNWDVLSLSSVTVGGTAYSQIAPGNQSGNVFNLNATKGFIEFVTAPGNGTAIVATYSYYVRAWTQCPADHPPEGQIAGLINQCRQGLRIRYS